MRCRFAFAISFLIAGTAGAQTQIKPRVMLMVDTSGSMTENFAGTDTDAEGSTFYSDSLMTRNVAVDKNLTPYIGAEVSTVTNQCVAANVPANEVYNGINSRTFAAKAAVTNVFNGSGDVEWGLMRYTGTQCTVQAHTFTQDNGFTPVIFLPTGRCFVGAECGSGNCNAASHRCACANSGQCPGGFTCVGGLCSDTGGDTCNDVGWTRNAQNFCICASDADCGDGVCDANGMCNCGNATKNACRGGNQCTQATHSCACNAATCAGGCNAGTCVCTLDSQCAGEYCVGGRCGFYNDWLPAHCYGNGDCEGGQTCSGGKCTCAKDDDCNNAPTLGFTAAQYCVPVGLSPAASHCGYDTNQCSFRAETLTDTRNGAACGNHTPNMGLTFGGDCGTGANANNAPCNSRLVCYQNSDCGSAGNCVKAAATDGWGECACTAGNEATQCRNAADYTCTGLRCVYNQACQSVGGTVLVDPAAAGYIPANILLFANGKEAVVGGADPELRANGPTPLAGAARSATTWYNAIKAYSLPPAVTSANCLAGTDANPLCDSKILCRPYVLVQMTDGADTCEGGDAAEGPVAAASAFVDATPAGARVPNKVYMIGLAANAALQTVLNDTAHFGGSGAARFANNQSDIEQALADIVVSSVLVEKCNYIDDDCNNVVDEPYPDVNAAAACSNGAVGHCAANGKFKCSTDQLSETCGPVSCRYGQGTTITKVDATHTRLNGATGFVNPADVNQFITIVSSRLPANRGTFQISSVNAPANSVTYLNSNGIDEGFPAGYEIYCTQQTSCRGNNLAGPLTKALNSMTLAGVSGFTAGDIGDAITISGAANALNNGTFPITAQTGTTVTFTNAAGVAQAAGAITWAVGCRSPSCKRGTAATLSGKAGNNINLVVPAGGATFVAGDAGKTLTIRSATNPGNVGNFTIAAFISATSVTLTNPNGVNEAGMVQWNIYCTNAESLGGCNNFDDDCNGIPDDCTEGVAGSCCTSSGCLPVETCNGLDDDCNGIIDDNPVDVGAACGNNVGDCAPGVVRCCNVDPATNGGVCPSPGPTDQPYCVGGNPGYPKAMDLCDGTDDNCDGVPNGVPPQPCYDDPTATVTPFPPALAGHGICQAGSQACTTPALPPGNGGCPAGWPAASPCPNPVPTFGACINARGPQPEVCNGVDDDCNDAPDDNVTDSWVGTACCPTGNINDCTNTNGGMGLGMRCATGTLVCLGGGQSCMGGTPKSAEICDGIDNDCNGIIDDVPGLGATCSANGVINAGACHATFICVPSTPGMCDGVPCPNGLTCNQTGTPAPEVCNGIDDDCNNIIDDPTEVVMNDPALMMPCDVPAPPNDKPPCMPGSPVCLNGKVQCQGAVTPLPNVCGQAATDCTGNPATDCPPGSMCFMGNCVTPCGAGEFPCPGGFVCDQTQTPPLCIPDACAKANCPPGNNCTVDSTGMAVCSDPCQDVNCPTGFRCQNGACVDDSCRTFGCPDGELCIGQPPACVADPCASLNCDTDQYCANGTCVPLCSVCDNGQRCVSGMCEEDPCAKLTCPFGKVCAITNGVGMCVTNTCVNTTCGAGQVCCGGACNNNPCDLVRCPSGIVCVADSTCNATCTAPPGPNSGPKDQIVGAGGGGFSCAMGGGGSDGGMALLFLGVLLFMMRRRREEVR